jgi:hypothetical protein
MKSVFVLCKNSREYSSGQLEHLASYFDSEAEATAAADKANEDEWQSLADNLGVENTEAWRDGYMGESPNCWIVVEEVE